jgi:hypothetical protein
MSFAGVARREGSARRSIRGRLGCLGQLRLKFLDEFLGLGALQETRDLGVVREADSVVGAQCLKHLHCGGTLSFCQKIDLQVQMASLIGLRAGAILAGKNEQ